MGRPFQTGLRWLLWAACTPALLAASWEQSGEFAIRSYTNREYSLSPQNWALAQDQRGILYAGNTEGLLEFDGVRWRTIRLPKNGPVRSLAVDGQGKVYVGGHGEFGFLQPDGRGATEYVSLVDSVPEADRKFSSVWSVLSTPEGIVFSSYERLFRKPPSGPLLVVRSAQRMRRAFLLNGSVHLVVNGAGLHRLDDGRLVPVAGGEAFAAADLRGALRDDQGTLLVSSKGLLRQTPAGFEPIAPALAPYLQDNAIYSAVALPGGLIALGTTRGGVLLLDSGYHVIRVLNRASGLPSDYIASLFADNQQGIWAATDNGIARFDLRFSRFDETHGLKGSVISLAHWGGTLYAGTTSGLFRLAAAAPGSPPRFEPIHKIQERFFVLLAREDGLWAGTTSGVYRWNESGLTRILPAEIVYDLAFSRRDPAVLFATGRFGAIQLRREGSEWKRVASLAPGGQEFRTVTEDRQGQLWITTLTGVVRADLSQSPPKVTQYALSDGLPDGWKNVYQAGGRLGIATEQGLRRFDEASKRFVPETEFGPTFADGGLGALIVREDPLGRVWVSGSGYHGFLARTAAGSPWMWHPMALLPLGLDEFWAVQVESQGVVWASSPAGFLARFQPAAEAPARPPLRLMIRRLRDSRKGEVLYGGSGAPPAGFRLPYSSNELRFDFASPFYDDPSTVEFQTLLEGSQAEWSPWTRESWRDLSNLWEGSYRLRVRARNPYGQVSNEASFAFQVLPPWYRSWWAYLLYVAVAGGAAWLIFKWRTYKLREDNRRLEQIVEERTVEIRLQRDEIKAQEEKSEALLLNILPATVAGELRATGTVAPMHFDDVTVCFTDFVGFTVSSETMEAREVVAQLDKYFTEFDLIISRYGIEKLKTIGDAYMFASGLPQSSPSHAVDAVLAALEILEKAKQLASAPGGTGWRLRVGLHSGPVVAGVVGVKKFAFDIWGDTVNLASRMESSGVPDRVNLSARTCSLVREFFDCEERGLVRTKDGRDLEMYFAGRMSLPAGTANGSSSREFLHAYAAHYEAMFGAAPRALPHDGVRHLLAPESYK